ncbi:flavin-containing monooxygenase [Aspergillus stella-maris]|uniref:flavin-containing monooxygenase n=1 Tax=Aspergillus stella-maris TaxID=1810926 RepID=UPI003CCCF345
MAISTEQQAANGHGYANGTENGVHIELQHGFTDPESLPHPRSVPLNPQYGYKPRKLRVITIGAGFSGLLMAHKIQHRFSELQEYVSHKIFEMRSDVGGTWLVNTYPGVQCDVPAHIYAFPFDPNPNWTKFYSSGAEIQTYIKDTVRKWNLDRDVHLNTRVVNARWLETYGVWKIIVEKNCVQRVEYAEILISGQGVLCHPSWPSIPGLHDFQGKIVHSARWDHDFDYSHKRIAVIGNGSSGIQITPQMAKLPGTEVVNYMRSAAWIYYRVPPSKHLGRNTDEVNPMYSEEDKVRFIDAEVHRQYRKGIIDRTNKAFKLFLKGENNEEAVHFGTEQMASKLNYDPELCRKLIPKWEVGCRRVTPGPGYLESFSRPNCNLSDSSITQITSNAVHTADGKVFECDVLICATGFDVSHCPKFPLIGLNGANLAEKWADEPESYLSVATAGFPNYFIFTGPNSLGGHGSLVEALNWTGDYLVKWIKKIASEDIKSVVPKKSAEEAFVRYGDEVHKTIVWTGGCKSWYKRNKEGGRVTALFGGSALLFNRLISELRPEDFEIEYRSANQFRFLGNGFLEYEMDPESDLAWYVELPEGLKGDSV